MIPPMRFLCPTLDVSTLQRCARFVLSDRKGRSLICQRIGTQECNALRLLSGPISQRHQSTTAVSHEASDRIAETCRSSKDDSLKTSYNQLRLAAQKHDLTAVNRLVRRLVEVEGEKPDGIFYEALITANASAIDGSAESVAHYMDDMRQNGLIPRSGLYHSALLALAVHPDHDLRNMILDDMSHQWIELSPTGHCYVLLGLLREGSLELAWQKLWQVIDQSCIPPQWLLDSFVFVLLEIGEIDDVICILVHVSKERSIESREIACQLLERSSDVFHSGGTRYAWQNAVQTGLVVPSDCICINVLYTAARSGDTDLAQSVFEVLRRRAFSFSRGHHEALIDTYLCTKDTNGALDAFCEMVSDGFEPSQASTIAVASYLEEDSQITGHAFHNLRRRNQEGKLVPSNVMNCIIEAAVLQGDTPRAIEYYKAIQHLCPGGANTATFNKLLSGCAASRMRDTTIFLASEMAALEVSPDNATFDCMILAFVRSQDSKSWHEDAWQCLEEMKDRGFAPRSETFLEWVQECMERSDDSARDILRQMEELGLDTEAAERLLDSS